LAAAVAVVMGKNICCGAGDEGLDDLREVLDDIDGARDREAIGRVEVFTGGGNRESLACLARPDTLALILVPTVLCIEPFPS
jgi:hypothetical protein